MYDLKIISSTVRPGRLGPLVTEWIADLARQDANFRVEILDLAQINAIEYLHWEWAYKAAGIVSYGGVSAGTRAANSLKLASMRVVTLIEAVNFPFFKK